MKNLTNSALTRRSVLKRITVGAAVVGWSTTSGSWAVAGADTTGVARLPRLDGTLETAPEVLSRFSADFGHLVDAVPGAVLRPGSVGDIVEMVRYARCNGLTIAMNGQSGSSADDLESHSNYGQAAVPGGISIDAKSLSTIHRIDRDSAWVDAGVTWAQLMDAAMAEGKMPPSHTDYQHLSIGGTISVGGIGGQVQKYGVQADTVSEIEIVTGRGYVVRASARENADLFFTALAGGGQVGIITKARVDLVPAPGRVTTFSLFYDDLGTYLADQQRILRDGRFDFQVGALARNATDTGWRYQIDAGAYQYGGNPPDRAALLAGLRDDRASATVADLPFRDWVFRMDPLEVVLKENGFWHQPHPWLSLVLPASTVAEFTRQLAAELTPADVGMGFALLYPFDTSKVNRPMFRTPDEPVGYLFDLLRLPPPGDQGIAGMLEQNRRLYDLAVSLGGMRYLIGAIPDMNQREWRRHFGADWWRLVAAKHRYDPDHVLTPGQGFFDRRRNWRR
ncbi:FAD-binding protein [Actinophytocola gossypii]|uniref:FAD-binding protein n=1 Tax=Actinophytocola gossypii TaxID=2812003 RepID=A0ABT2J279_9PSEU|nr:FAD-binding protein [Actinophytocola gossypii]MCT2581963.1 FAD-binding protein [Actinophytocola gossypii]